jgi:hypothetical protein
MVTGLLVDVLPVLVAIAVLVFAIFDYRSGGDLIDAQQKNLVSVPQTVYTSLRGYLR